MEIKIRDPESLNHGLKHILGLIDKEEYDRLEAKKRKLFERNNRLKEIEQYKQLQAKYGVNNEHQMD